MHIFICVTQFVENFTSNMKSIKITLGEVNKTFIFLVKKCLLVPPIYVYVCISLCKTSDNFYKTRYSIYLAHVNVIIYVTYISYYFYNICLFTSTISD